MRVVFARFQESEEGAVTVDWVLLTAGVIGLVFAVIPLITNSVLDESTGVGAYVAAQEIPTYQAE